MRPHRHPAATEARGPSRLCVLLSGGGRTMLNLADAIDRGDLPATISLVVASKQCAGAERARQRGLPTRVVPGIIPRDTLAALLDEHRIDWAVLAGYLKIVQIPDAYRGRIVNIHPALLPDFGGPGMYGDRVHAAVLASGATHSGCTVHLCDDEYDRGPILLQRTCPVLAGDNVHTLATRVFEEEKRAYPEALRLLIQGEQSCFLRPVS